MRTSKGTDSDAKGANKLVQLISNAFGSSTCAGQKRMNEEMAYLAHRKLSTAVQNG